MSGTRLNETSIEPARLYDDADVPTQDSTYTHEATDYSEAGTAGLSIVGVTDDDGRLLLVIEPEAGHAVLPHTPVETGDKWATIARDHVAAASGLEVELEAIILVRRVEHRVEGETAARETTHHVLFAASPVGGTFEGLCETNDWELRWCEKLPEGIDADDNARTDIQRLLD